MKKLYFSASKDTINRVTRKPTKWEKIVEMHVSDKVLIFRIYQEHIYATIRNNSKMSKELG